MFIGNATSLQSVSSLTIPGEITSTINQDLYSVLAEDLAAVGCLVHL